jgi:hypothetical protein
MTKVEPFKASDVVQRECRFAFNTDCRESGEDFHLIKEAVTLSDGRVVPNVVFRMNYKRPFWIVKKGERDFKEFKEAIDRKRLDRFETTQSNLAVAVARALGKQPYREGLRALCQEPYVYGCDISSTALIKHEYNQKAPVVTQYSNAAYDTETDEVHGTHEVIMNSVSFKDRIVTSIKASYLKGISQPLEQILKLVDLYLGEYLTARNAKVEMVVHDSEIDTIRACINRAHEWQPDWLSVWNIEFDMDKITDACEKAGVNPASLLSDPKVPKEFQYFKFTKGAAKKVTASGRVINFSPSQRWHKVKCPASFHWIDAMQVYRQVRTGAAEEPSYSLDAILEKHKLPAKLKFKDLDDADMPASNTLDWHVFMQLKYPIHYVVYHIFDCIAMELLDEATKDLSLSMPMFAGCTDFADFNSLPRKAMNDLHWFYLQGDEVVGATSTDMTVEDDELTTDVKGWITMLSAHQIYDNGLCLIEEVPDLRTNIRTHGADLDVEGAYPTNESTMNVSKATTARELTKVMRIDGSEIPEEIVRMQTINFSAGVTNAVEFCTTMFGMPNLDDLVDHYDATQLNLPPAANNGYFNRFAAWLSASMPYVNRR